MYNVIESTPDANLAGVVVSHNEYISNALGQPFVASEAQHDTIAEEVFKVRLRLCVYINWSFIN